MKKIAIVVTLALFASTLIAQRPKILSLEQTVAAVYQKQYIDSIQKRKIDSMIVKLKLDRKALASAKKEGKFTEEEFRVKEKQVSQNFTDSLKKVLGGDLVFKKWQVVRYQQQQTNNK